MQRLDPDALEQYVSSRDVHTKGSNFSHPEGIDEDIRV